MIGGTARFSGFGVLCALAVALAAAPAAAQSSTYGPYAGTSWSLKKVRVGTGECTMIVNHGSMGLDRSGAKIAKETNASGTVALIEWTGACDANRLISGRGTLFIDLDATGNYFSKRFVGTADRGAFNGAVSYNGFYDLEADDYGELDPDQAITFANGCNNWAGAAPSNCDKEQAARLRTQYLAGFTPASKPAPTAPKAAPVKPAGPVAVEIAPSATRSLNAEQNTAAAAWLKADTEAKRIQAEKVADFERKKADFDRQQSDYQRQQAEYQAALAAHKAETDRIAKHNADVEACNKGDKTRCP
ncbi:MAG: hypothetical protein IBJ13_06650 [Sphingopyxis sp.]|nr:hypothetical protein [Sphingopyxis sp.]